MTLLSQSLSEFELHARAIWACRSRALGPRAGGVCGAAPGRGHAPRLGNLAEALTVPTSDLRLFGKPDPAGRRRLGVALALGTSVDEARARARSVIEAIRPRPKLAVETAVPCVPGTLGASVDAVSGVAGRGPLPESSATYRLCACAARAVRPTTAGAAGTLTARGQRPLKPPDRLHFSHLARAREPRSAP